METLESHLIKMPKEKILGHSSYPRTTICAIEVMNKISKKILK